MSLTSRAGTAFANIVGALSASMTCLLPLAQLENCAAMLRFNLVCLPADHDPALAEAARRLVLSARCFVKQFLKHCLYTQRLQNVLHGRVRISSNVGGCRDLMRSEEFLGFEQAERSCSLVRVSLTMNQKLCPEVEYGCPREIIDVDIPAAVEARADHQARVVIKQDLSRIVESADVHHCLSCQADSLAGQTRKHSSDLFLMAGLHSQEHAKFVSYAVSCTLPWGGGRFF